MKGSDEKPRKPFVVFFGRILFKKCNVLRTEPCPEFLILSFPSGPCPGLLSSSAKWHPRWHGTVCFHPDPTSFPSWSQLQGSGPAPQPFRGSGKNSHKGYQAITSPETLHPTPSPLLFNQRILSQAQSCLHQEVPLEASTDPTLQHNVKVFRALFSF